MGDWLTEPKFSILDTLAYISVGLLCIYIPCLVYCLTWPVLQSCMPPRLLALASAASTTIQFNRYTPLIAFCTTIDAALGVTEVVFIFCQIFFTKISARVPRRAEAFIDFVLDSDERSWQRAIAPLARVGRFAGNFVVGFFVWAKHYIVLMHHLHVLKGEKAEIVNGYCTKEAREAYSWAFAASYGELARIYMENTVTHSQYKMLEAAFVQYKTDNPDDGLRELGEKALSYRLSHIELVKDCNWYRICVANIINWYRHSSCTNLPAMNKSVDPCVPRQLCFTADANPDTKLHYDTTINTLPRLPLAPESTQSTELSSTAPVERGIKALARPGTSSSSSSSSSTAPLARGIKALVRPGTSSSSSSTTIPSSSATIPSSSRYDPFANDGALIKATFPGIHLGPAHPFSNPMYLSTKRPPRILQPEARFGTQIEDVAMTGSLAAWNAYKRVLPRYRSTAAAVAGAGAGAGSRAGRGPLFSSGRAPKVVPSRLRPSMTMRDSEPVLLPETPALRLGQGLAAQGSPMDTSPVHW